MKSAEVVELSEEEVELSEEEVELSEEEVEMSEEVMERIKPPLREIEQSFDELVTGIVKAELEKKFIAAENELNEVKKVTDAILDLVKNMMIPRLVEHSTAIQSLQEEIKNLKSPTTYLDKREMMCPLGDERDNPSDMQGRPQVPSTIPKEAGPSDQHVNSNGEESKRPVLSEFFQPHRSSPDLNLLL